MFQAKGQASAKASVGTHRETSVWIRVRAKERKRTGPRWTKTQVALMLLLLPDCLVLIKMFLIFDIVS